MKDVCGIVTWFSAISDDQKRELFGQLLAECSTILLAELEELVHEARKKDFILNLPAEVVDVILGYLAIDDLVTVQLVCKRWLRAVVGRRPFFQLVCERLNVEASEYDSPEQAIAICRYILKKNKSEAVDWFALTSLKLDTGSWSVDTVSYATDGDQPYVASVTTKGFGPPMVNKLDVTAIRQDQSPLISQFSLANEVSAIRILDGGIFCGNYLGFVERWTLAGEQIMTYWQHGGAVFAIDGNVERDILFTGGGDRSVRCWRISTGQPLSVVDSFDHWVKEVKMMPIVDCTSPVIIAVLSKSQPVDPSGNGILSASDVLSLSIFSYSEDGQRLTVLREIKCQLQISSILPTITATEDGFGFICAEKHDDIKFFECEYAADTGNIVRRPISLDSGVLIHSILGLGRKYCLVLLGDLEGYLAVLERHGSVWKLYKRFPFLSTNYNGRPIQWTNGPVTRHNSCRYVLGSRDWLNGFRSDQIGQLAFIAFRRDDVTCAFLK